MAMDWVLFLGGIAALGGVGAAISAYFSMRAFKEDRINRDTERLLAIAIQNLERAWNALTDGGLHANPPRNNRLNWLTAARLVLSYKDVKQNLKNKSALVLCEAEEEHWRHKFYLSLESLSQKFGYYEGPDDKSGALDPTSALVVHKFADWPEKKEDPLSRYGRVHDESFDELRVSHKWMALRSWMGSF